MAKNVFILGAGSSSHLGYPLGKDLVTDILAITCKDPSQFPSGIPNRKLTFRTFENPTQRSISVPYYDLISIVSKNDGISKSTIDKFFEKLLGNFNLVPSIDAFLSNLSSDELIKIGKIALSIAILKSEDETHFSQRPNWYDDFLRPLYPIKGKSFDFSNFNIITFNYDRSLDWFIYNKIYQHFHLNLTDFSNEEINTRIEQSINSLNIFHVYGVLIKSDFEAKPPYGVFQSLLSRIQFDNNLDKISSLLLESSKNIKTIYELTTDDTKSKLYPILASHSDLAILGFGFHAPNFEIMGIDKSVNQLIHANKIYSTGFQLSNKRKNDFEDLIENKSDIGFEIKYGDWSADVNSFYKFYLG